MIYRTATLTTPQGLVYAFTEEAWMTRLEVRHEPNGPDGKSDLIEIHDSVSMPELSDGDKRATFTILPGYSRKNKMRHVVVDYVHATIQSAPAPAR